MDIRPTGVVPLARGPVGDRRDFAGTVREYLGQQLAQESADDRTRLLTLADGLVGETLGRGTGEEVDDDPATA